MKSHQIVVEVGPLEEIMNVRFGSLAAVDNLTTLMTAFGCIADVRFEQKPIFDSPVSARSGHQQFASSVLILFDVVGRVAEVIDVNHNLFFSRKKMGRGTSWISNKRSRAKNLCILATRVLAK